MTTFRIIKPDGTSELRECSLTAGASFGEIRAVLRPIFETQRAGKAINFERVSVYFNGRMRDAFVDAYGFGCFGYEQLPINLEATKIYHAASIARGAKCESGVIPSGDPIFGLMVLFEDEQVWS